MSFGRQFFASAIVTALTVTCAIAGNAHAQQVIKLTAPTYHAHHAAYGITDRPAVWDGSDLVWSDNGGRS